MTAAAALFYALAAGAILTALAVITARNVVWAVLAMIGNFLLTAVIYLLLQAPFIAVVQVVVYAGAIMVLFLFVVMILGGGRAGLDEPLVAQRPLGVVLLALLGALLVRVTAGGAPAAPAGGVAPGELPALPGGFGSPQALGAALFRDHVLGLETVSVLLLAAMLGAVVIAHFPRRDRAGPSEGEDRP
jgi:NADH-quinone oxidoreductase subunit J